MCDLFLFFPGGGVLLSCRVLCGIVLVVSVCVIFFSLPRRRSSLVVSCVVWCCACGVSVCDLFLSSQEEEFAAAQAEEEAMETEGEEAEDDDSALGPARSLATRMLRAASNALWRREVSLLLR